MGTFFEGFSRISLISGDFTGFFEGVREALGSSGLGGSGLGGAGSDGGCDVRGAWGSGVAPGSPWRRSGDPWELLWRPLGTPPENPWVS